MAQLLDAPETRIVAIMTAAYGTRPLTANRFRRSIDNATLRDPIYPPVGFDRAFELEWESLGQWSGSAYNPIDGITTKQLTLSLNVGYAYGREFSNNVSTTGSESASTSVLHARKRALSDAAMIERAMIPAGTDDLGNGVWMSVVRMDGPVTIEDLGGGKLIAVSRYQILVTYDPATDFSP